VSRSARKAPRCVNWGLACIRIPGSHESEKDLLGHVTDMGEEATNAFVSPLSNRPATSPIIAIMSPTSSALLVFGGPRGGGEPHRQLGLRIQLASSEPQALPRFAALPGGSRSCSTAANEQRDGSPAWYPDPPCRFAAYACARLHRTNFRSVVASCRRGRRYGRRASRARFVQEIASLAGPLPEQAHQTRRRFSSYPIT
jgi:hypothetical protein